MREIKYDKENEGAYVENYNVDDKGNEKNGVLARNLRRQKRL